VVLFGKVCDAPPEVYRRGYPGYPPEYKADYRIEDYHRAIEKLTGTVLRNVVGEMTLEHALTARDEINGKLLLHVNATTEPDWGVTVTRVEIITIDPPPAVKDAMEHKQGAILEAQGQARAIDTVFRAIHQADPDPKVLAYQYLRVLPQLTQGQGSTVVVIPSELTSALKAVSAAFGIGQPGQPEAGQPGQPEAGQPGQPEAGQPGQPEAGQPGLPGARSQLDRQAGGQQQAER
jgi:regulator of protease activity HflC (stomatin/prohibitin superfamily)